MKKFFLLVLLVGLNVQAGSSASAQCCARMRQEECQAAQEKYQAAYSAAYRLGTDRIQRNNKKSRVAVLNDLVMRYGKFWFSQGNLQAYKDAFTDLSEGLPNKFA